MAFGSFRSTTPEEQCLRRALKAADTTILDPASANTLEQGEWVTPNGTDPTTWERYAAADVGPVTAYPVGAPAGSTDGQALGKIDAYEKWEVAYTTCYDGEGGVGSYDPGDKLKVNQVAIGGVNRSVLTVCDTDWDNVVAVVLEGTATPGDYDEIKIQRSSGYYHT